MSLVELQNYTFQSRYANYLKEKKRRESWKNAVDRSRKMMLTKYSEFGIEEIINEAYDGVYRKEFLGSQRVLQFAGPAMLKHNARGYNCTFSYADRPRFFQEAMYLLLCGCGVGFSVQKHHIKKLPSLVKEKSSDTKIYNIPDSIEGWSDSLGILINSYFKNGIYPEYEGKNVTFRFHLIRPAGAELSSSSGKAPGPEPLKKALRKVRAILDEALKNGQKKLTSIQIFDIVMHASDAVLAGGVRRSATICLFSIDDEKMLNAKTGNWFHDNPQRARANITVPLLKDSTSKKDFLKVFYTTKEFGEPGYNWTDSLEFGWNPCQPSFAKLLSKNGITSFHDIKIGQEIWSNDGWTKVVKKWSNGYKEVYKYTTTAGIFYGTENHRIIENNKKIEVKDAESIDIFTGLYLKNDDFNNQIIMDGLVLGDGSVHQASNNLVFLLIGKDDKDYFDSEISNLLLKDRSDAFATGEDSLAYEIKTNILAKELPKTYKRFIPSRYIKGSRKDICSLLRGLYSANGSICGNRITLKSSSKELIEDVQLLLSSIGIVSYYTTNKPSEIEWDNGTYISKESYDLNITTDSSKFIESIGFIQKYKNEIANKLSKNRKRRKFSYEIIQKELLGTMEVFDITVDNDSHTYWTQGCNVSNCGEANLYPVHYETGEVGWEFCNLCTINASKLKSEEDFYRVARLAAIVGTLQAGFTDFPYLGRVTEEIVRREALLGVSMTGMMENPDICLNPNFQRKAAEIIKKVNAEIAKKIGINPTARGCLNKPDGTSSALLGTSSGIHCHPSKRFLRNIQSNKMEPVYKFFQGINPHACQDSVWSANDTDGVISFCVEVPPRSRLKKDLTAIEFLEIVKSTQQNWVLAGKNEENCVDPRLCHAISNTCIVKEHEWEEVADYIYDNRHYLANVSLLAESGDKDYAQAPFISIYTPAEITKEYGDASVFVSGLIDTALDLYDDNLWQACDVLLGLAKLRGKAKKDWAARCNKFAKKYLEGNVKKLTYLMKDVYNWKLWLDLNREYKPVDYEQMVEETDGTNLQGEVACGGGSCELR